MLPVVQRSKIFIIQIDGGLEMPAVVPVRDGDAVNPAIDIGGAPDGALPIEAVEENSSAFKISDVVINARDSAGRQITEVFAKLHDFAIYSAAGQIHVQLSDDETRAKIQYEKIAVLQPYREKLEYFAVEQGAAATKYQRQIAAALRLGLLDQTMLANSVLEDAIQNAIQERARNSRISFIPAATIMALPIAIGLLLLTLVGRDPDVTFAMAGGALGAYLSMAIGIRTRALSPEVSAIPNYVDSGLRVAIGILSAGALLLLLTSGLVNLPSITGTAAAGADLPLNWRLAVILGFAAGFLERLLPDLLSKQFPQSDNQSPTDLKSEIAKAAEVTETKAQEEGSRAAQIRNFANANVANEGARQDDGANVVGVEPVR